MSKFIHCYQCGTRNFYDEQNCGVCSTNLHSRKITVNENEKPAPSFNLASILFVSFCTIGIAFIIYNIYGRVSGKDTAEVQIADTVIIKQENRRINSSTSDLRSFHYDIVEISLNNKRAFNASVKLAAKIPDAELLVLAEKIKQEINPVSNVGVVFFLLPEMKIKDGAWAAVDFLPQKRLRMSGLSISAENSLKSGIDNITDYVGLWMDNSDEDEIIIRIRLDKKNGYVFEYITASEHAPSENSKQLVKKTRNNKTIFLDSDHEGQFFQIDSNGDLSVYDELGFVETYKMLRMKK